MISDDHELAASYIRDGKIIIFPTETVYGIGAAARNLTACHRIYEIKNRPADNPLIWHFDCWDHAKDYVVWNKSAEKLTQNIKTGPLTLVLCRKDQSTTLACRVPSHETAQKFLKACKEPVAAPSANVSGRPSLTRISMIERTFHDKVDFILTGAEPNLGLESSVLDVSDENKITLLRPGHVSRAKFEQILRTTLYSATAKDYHKSPGMKYRHYAPAKPVFLVRNLPLSSAKDARIGFQVEKKISSDLYVADNLAYAANLYAFLESSDLNPEIERIFCQYPLDDEYQESLLNRLNKASQSLSNEST